LVWSEETLARARRGGAGDIVTFGWPDGPGEEEGYARAETGMDYAAADVILGRAAELATTWFKRDGREYLRWEDAAVGAACAADLFAYFNAAVRWDVTLAHWYDRSRPGRVALVDDGSARAAVLRAALAGRGVPVRLLAGAGVTRARAALGVTLRRWGAPLMWPLALRRMRTAGPPPRADVRVQGPGQAVFWGQFGGFELDVYRALAERWGGPLPYVAATVPAGQAARAAGLAVTSLFDALPPAGVARRAFRALRTEYRALARRGLFEGFGLGPGVAAALRADFPFRPGAYLNALAWRAAAVATFLERSWPALIIHMGDAHVTGRLVTTLARRRHIPALVLQHHITGGPTFGYLPLTSSVMAAWGPVSRDWFVAGGAPASRVVVVGSTYAALAARPPERAAPGARRDLVVATNNFDAEHNRAVAAAAAAYARAPGAELRLVFRPHPQEAAGFYRALLKGRGPADAVVAPARERPLAEVLRTAAVVVAGHSGVGVDAVLAGVPLVHVNLMAGIPDYIPYVEYGAAVAASRLDELGKAVAAARALPSARWEAGRRAFAAAYLGSGAGEPFANAVALAQELRRAP